MLGSILRSHTHNLNFRNDFGGPSFAICRFREFVENSPHLRIRIHQWFLRFGLKGQRLNLEQPLSDSGGLLEFVYPVTFYGLYHGIHHHFSPPFGRNTLNVIFSNPSTEESGPGARVT